MLLSVKVIYSEKGKKYWVGTSQIFHFNQIPLIAFWVVRHFSFYQQKSCLDSTQVEQDLFTGSIIGSKGNIKFVFNTVSGLKYVHL